MYPCVDRYRKTSLNPTQNAEKLHEEKYCALSQVKTQFDAVMLLYITVTKEVLLLSGEWAKWTLTLSCDDF